MIQILRKKGWKLNPNDKVVNAILNRLEMTGGVCPCDNPEKLLSAKLCPCKEYRENDVCHCTLYVKEDESKD